MMKEEEVVEEEVELVLQYEDSPGKCHTAKLTTKPDLSPRARTTITRCHDILEYKV